MRAPSIPLAMRRKIAELQGAEDGPCTVMVVVHKQGEPFSLPKHSERDKVIEVEIVSP